MKQLPLLAALAATIIGASAAAGAVRANEMAEKAAVKASASVQNTPAQSEVTVSTLDEVTAAELQVLIDTTQGLVIVDARDAASYAESHIPGAVQLRPVDATEEKLAELIPSKDTPIVFYCTNTQCAASGKAAHKAAEYGYSRLYKYTGGIEDWQAKGLPVVSGKPAA